MSGGDLMMIGAVVLAAALVLWASWDRIARWLLPSNQRLPARVYRDSSKDEDENILAEYGISATFAEVANTSNGFRRSIKVFLNSVYVGHLTKLMGQGKQLIDAATETWKAKTDFKRALSEYHQIGREDDLKQAKIDAEIAEARKKKAEADRDAAIALDELNDLLGQSTGQSWEERREKKAERILLWEIRQRWGKPLQTLQAIDELYDKVRENIRCNPKLTPKERRDRFLALNEMIKILKEQLLQEQREKSSGKESKPSDGWFKEGE